MGRPFLGVALAQGLRAGLVGTLAVSASDVLERRLLGRETLYVPHRLMERIFAKHGVLSDGARMRGKSGRSRAPNHEQTSGSSRRVGVLTSGGAPIAPSAPDGKLIGALGRLFRYSYGLTLGVLYATSRQHTGFRLRSALALGWSIMAFEVLTAPRVGATPPYRSWSGAERQLLVWHTALYGIVTELALALGDRAIANER